MTRRTRFAYAAIALFLAMFGAALAIISNSTRDCWSQYTTEDEAVYNCEQHHG